MILAPPTNTYFWLFLSIGLFILAYRSVRQYLRSGQSLPFWLAAGSLSGAFSGLLMFLPFLFTTDTTFLSLYFIFADVFAHVAYCCVSMLVWLTILGRRIHYAIFGVPYLLLVAAAYMTVVTEYYPDGVQVVDGLLVFPNSTTLGQSLFSIVLSALIPLGAYFILQLRNTKTLRGKLSSATIGLFFIGFGGVFVLTPVYTDPSSTSFTISAVVALLFVGATVLTGVLLGRKAPVATSK